MKVYNEFNERAEIMHQITAENCTVKMLSVTFLKPENEREEHFMKKLFAVLLAVLMVAVMATAMAETTLKVAGWDITTTPYYTAIK